MAKNATTGSGTLSIRVVSSQDAGTLVASLVALVGGFRDHLGAKTPTDSELANILPEALDDPTIEFCCAWLGDEAVGYTQTHFTTSVWIPGIEARLDDLFVTSAARGQKAGRSLLDHAIDRARERGASRLVLNTNEGNVAAQSLYRSAGMAPEAHELYPDGREIVWRLSL